MNLKIKEMIELGFARKRIANKLEITIQEINKVSAQIKKENFDESKIDYICSLYEQGISAKSLGYKYSIDKRRIQNWAFERGFLRDKNQSNRFTNFNQTIFDKINSEEKAYWLGFFYADAYNCNKTSTVSLSLQISDLNHLNKLAKFMDLPESKIKYTKTKKNYEYYTLQMYSKYLCSSLNEKGCPQCKSFIITYPSFLEKKYTISFIRGLFDGDGCLCKRNNNEWKWSLATTKECGESIQKIILDELGLIVNLSYISKTNNNTYELESNGNEKVLKLADWLYKNSPKHIRLDRKYDKYLELIEQQDNRTFTKGSSKVSNEDKSLIIKEINEGKDIMDIAKDNKLHQRTVTKILSDNTFFDKVVIINGNPITAKYVKTLDYDERMALVDPLFEHFRKQGWLYPDNPSKLKKNYKTLCEFKPDLTVDELFNNSSMATDICKYFCHKFYDATEFNKPIMKEIFEDDEKLKYLIKNRLGFDWWDKEDNDETFNISFRMLVQGLRSSRLVPSISIFKPNIAKYLYMKYSQENDVVFDYSAGWGGRLLGAAACNRKYIGVDPWTTDELENMINYLELKNISLIKNGSENVKLEENSIDFSFSSPPYLSQEVYCKDITQAYNQGDDYFYNVYWKNTLSNIKYMLKPGKWFGLNILDKYDRMIDMAKEEFGDVIEIVKLRTIRSHLTKNKGVEKYEPVFMFKNSK